MKKAIFIIALALSTISIQAQQKGESQLSLGYGIASTPELVDLFVGTLTYPTSLGTVSFSDLETVGNVHLTYKYAISDKWLLGGTFVYNRTKQNARASNAVIGEQTYRNLTLAVESDYRYISNPKFQMYSGLGVGITLTKENFDPSSTANAAIEANSNYFNYQLTAVGFRIGRKLAFFSEIGFGYKGILSAGINYQF